MIIKCQVTSDEIGDFLREYEIPLSMNLLDLHNHIQKDLNYSSVELASFFASDDNWNRHQEFTLIDMDINTALYDSDEYICNPILMTDITLQEVIDSGSRRLIYLFDMLMERELHIEILEDCFKEEDKIYPNTILSLGEAPDQLGNIDEDIEDFISQFSLEFDDEI